MDLKIESQKSELEKLANKIRSSTEHPKFDFEKFTS